MKQSSRGGALVRPGVALKAFRKERKMTLADVSERCGLTVSTLSKAENGKMELTLDKLLRISLALDVNIADLFGSPSGQFSPSETAGRRSITKLGGGKVVTSEYGQYSYHAYDLLSKKGIPIVADITAQSIEEFGEFHRHDGEEFVYVIDGALELYTDLYMPTLLETGESIYFDSGMGHAYVAHGGPCRILIVCHASDPDLIPLMEQTPARQPLQSRRKAGASAKT